MPASSNQALQPFTIAPQAGLCPAEGASNTPRSIFFVQQIYVYVGFTHHLHMHTHLNALALHMESPEPQGYSSHENTQLLLPQHNQSSQSFPKDEVGYLCALLCSIIFKTELLSKPGACLFICASWPEAPGIFLPPPHTLGVANEHRHTQHLCGHWGSAL